MRKLMEYSPTTPMTDDFKLTLLKNAVQDAPHLASVESAYDVTTRLGSGSPGAMDYNGYMEVLLSAAQNHDAKISPTTRSQNRRANAHSLFPTDEEQYDIDTSVDTKWVNAHNTVLAHYSNGTCVSDDTWSKLPHDSRNIWMSLPIDDRKLILEQATLSPVSPRHPLPRHPGVALDADVKPLLGIATNARSCSWTSNQKTLLRLPNR
jgi:hypothetical protein